MIRHIPAQERRKWPRLPIAIPVFVRSKDEKGKEVLEFATALNISAGGALIIVRRAPSVFSQVVLEIPSPPLGLGSSVPKATRALRAKMLRVTHADGYHLLGVKFSKPLVAEAPVRTAVRRKVRSVV